MVEVMNSLVSFSPLRRIRAVAALCLVAVLPLPAIAESAKGPETAVAEAPHHELVMVEQTGCEWCKRWNEEIAPIYPKTSEGAFAPLRRVDLRAIPDDLQVTRRVNFTPTFLIVKDGHEMARLEGYPGEDFFWPVIAKLFSTHLGYAPDGTDRPES